MRERVRVECAWFLALAGGPGRARAGRLPRAAAGFARGARPKIPAATDVAAIKQIESRTNHDVKAVEIWLRGELQSARRGRRRNWNGCILPALRKISTISPTRSC